MQKCALDGEVTDGHPAGALSLAGLATDVRLKGEALARVEARLAEVERQLARLGPSGAVAVLPAGDVSLEEGLSHSEGSSTTPKDCLDEYLECAVKPTVWDAPVIIGLPAVGSGASTMLCASMLLNGLLQVYICFILLTCNKFNNPRPWKDQEESAHMWRIHVAHEANQLDASGASLAGRVCGADNSLSVASSQSSTLDLINDYLSLQPADLVVGSFAIGPLLCALCVLIFVVLILRELRCVATLLYALYSLPRGKHSHLEGGAFVKLSSTRLFCVILVSVVRTGVALVLLYGGVVWLAATTSITDLILNAAALGFVLDLDELLYETVVPAAVHTFVDKVKPLTYRRPPRSIDAMLPLAALAALVCLSISMLVLPNVADMLAVKRAFCSGNTDFVVKQNVAGFVVARATAPFGEDADWHDSRAELRSKAVEELLAFEIENPNTTSVTQYSMQKFNWEEFEMDANSAVRDQAESALCEDMDKAYDGKLLREMPGYAYTIRETTGLHRNLSLAEMPWNCSDYAGAGFCQQHALVRLFCPVSCGCTDPKSGLLFGQTMQGCPGQCQPMLRQASAALPCEDSAPGDAWRDYWEEYAAFMARVVPQMHEVYANFSARKIARGCNDISLDPVHDHLLCDERTPWMKSRGIRSIAPFCPELCCRRPDPGPLCSSSCPRRWQ